MEPTRRQLVLGAVTSLATACAASRTSGPVAPVGAAPSALDAIEAATGGRLGVFAVDTGNGRELSHRADERFAMCSTFKWVLAAAILAETDRGAVSLDEHLPYSAADLPEYSPVSAQHVAEGEMEVGALAEAAVTVSDNGAANLLLARIGGPPAVTRFVRALGDPVTRLDRNEPTLNSNIPGDPRDTTCPRVMVGLLRQVLCGAALSPASRARLMGWMRACQTGMTRLRAGLPADWVVADKTGSGARNAINDVAMVVPPNRAPILVAAYTSDSSSERSVLDAAHAAVGRLVARDL